MVYCFVPHQSICSRSLLSWRLRRLCCIRHITDKDNSLVVDKWYESISRWLGVVGKDCVHRAVSVITDIVDSLGTDGVSRSKQLCYTSLSDHIDTASQLLTVYMQHQHPGELPSIFMPSSSPSLSLAQSGHLSKKICKCQGIWHLSWKCQENDQKSGKCRGKSCHGKLFSLTFKFGWDAGGVICLERGANDLHMVQLMPLPPHHLLLQQNPEWFIFLVPA